MKINWTVRFKNKHFWITLVPSILLLIQVVASLFGFELNFSEISAKIITLVDVIFVLLTILGVVTDPTTKGISDSDKAMYYREPD